MRTLYIDCGMGAAGDMLASALAELTGDVEKAVAGLNAMHIPGVEYAAERTEKCGIVGTHISVLVNGRREGDTPRAQDAAHREETGHAHGHHGHTHPHTHHGMTDIEHIVREHIHASEYVKTGMLEVYRIIAGAESAVHGVPVSEIHFHEVGTMDAVADIAAVCCLMERLQIERVIASPVHVGRGSVQCAHGILPVPAPATALILNGVPIYSLPEIEGELCTPTGAALLKYFVGEFRPMPVLRCEKIGYGMGRKDFPAANCVRAFLGETEGGRENIFELNFTVDDMTGEEIGFAVNEFLANGAKDAFTTPVGMKKGRPGLLITVLAAADSRDRLIRLIFRHTTTLGIRETLNSRYIMERTVSGIETAYGTIRRKDASGYGVRKAKYEYDDIIRAAKENDCSMRDILKTIKERGGAF